MALSVLDTAFIVNLIEHSDSPSTFILVPVFVSIKLISRLSEVNDFPPTAELIVELLETTVDTATEGLLDIAVELIDIDKASLLSELGRLTLILPLVKSLAFTNLFLPVILPTLNDYSGDESLSCVALEVTAAFNESKAYFYISKDLVLLVETVSCI